PKLSFFLTQTTTEKSGSRCGPFIVAILSSRRSVRQSMPPTYQPPPRRSIRVQPQSTGYALGPSRPAARAGGGLRSLVPAARRAALGRYQHLIYGSASGCNYCPRCKSVASPTLQIRRPVVTEISISSTPRTSLEAAEWS